MAEKTKGPNTPSEAYQKMKPDWDMVRTLLGGTKAMRAAGKTYLPQHTRELDEDYKVRLGTSTLVNYFEWTLDSLVSKPFAEQPNVDEIPAKLKEVVDDIDLQGNDLVVFLRGWFREAYAKAFAHVLVEFPRPKPRADGQPRTLEDDRRDNIRPYWVHVAPENVLFAHSEMVNGVERLTHVRILETEVVVDGWEEKTIERIRVLRPGQVELWVFSPGSKKWVKEDEWDTGLADIPFVTYYAGEREDLMMAKPPLIDLAYMNVLHWQSSSDQRNALTVARFPILAGSGVSESDAGNVVVGPKRLLTTTDPQGKFYYVEHTGAALDAGLKDIQALEQQMAGYGATFLTAKPGSQTATARVLDSAEAISPLQASVLMFEDAVERALDFTAQWLKLGDSGGGRVIFNKEFGLSLGDSTGLDVLRKTRDAKDMSRKAFMEELKRRGILSGEYDVDLDQEEIADEATNGAASIELDPAAPNGDGQPPKPGDQPPPKDGDQPPKEGGKPPVTGAAE